MIDNDIYFPIGFMAARPYITHLMGTAILTTAGSEVGETLVGHADFQLSDNVVQKMHYGNFTFYAKSVIYAPEKVLIVTDIISKRYISGNDMTIFDHESYAAFRKGSSIGRSILIFAIPADRSNNGIEYANPIDISGSYANEYSNVAEAQEMKMSLFATSWWYSNRYNLSNTRNRLNSTDYFNYANRMNTMCFQGHQFNWNPSTMTYSFAIQNTGHWGPKVYEGVAQVRSGQMKLMRDVNYSMFGASGMGAMASVPLGY
jgi:hypothetical protein